MSTVPDMPPFFSRASRPDPGRVYPPFTCRVFFTLKRKKPHKTVNKRNSALTKAVITGTLTPQRRRIEQLAARRAHNPEVVGSSPTPATY